MKTIGSQDVVCILRDTPARIMLFFLLFKLNDIVYNVRGEVASDSTAAVAVRHNGTQLLRPDVEPAGGDGEGEDGEIRPMFKATPKNITASPGDRAVLKCRVENLGTKIVTWRKKNEIHPLTIGLHQFTPDTRVSVDYNQRTTEWNLIIQDVRPNDEGLYQCQISTKNDRDSYEVMLNIKNVQVYGTEYVEAGGTIRLRCNATGKPDPPHNVDWFKGPERINSDSQGGIIITKKIDTRVLVSLLEIRNSQASDTGQYICRSSNGDSGQFAVRVIQGSYSRNDQQRFNSQSFGSSSFSGKTHSIHTARDPTINLTILISLLTCYVLYKQCYVYFK